MLEGNFDVLREPHWIGDMETVQRVETAIGAFLDQWATIVGIGERLIVAPCIVEVVLCASAIDRGHGIMVNEDHVVALAEPSFPAVVDIEKASCVVPSALGLEKDIVVFPFKIETRLRRQIVILVEDGMEKSAG